MSEDKTREQEELSKKELSEDAYELLSRGFARLYALGASKLPEGHEKNIMLDRLTEAGMWLRMIQDMSREMKPQIVADPRMSVRETTN